MKRVLHYIAGLFVAAFLMGGTFGATIPQNVSASCGGGGFFLSTWYEGLTTTDGKGDCVMVSPTEGGVTIESYILTIGLNVVTIILQIIGYAAVGFIIYGGFQFMISSGAPEQRSSAMKTILNAIVGLVIAITSVAILRLVGGIFTGGTTNNVGLYTGMSGSEVLASVLNIAYWAAGAVAVIMVVISGFNFTTSAGDPQKAAKARNGLLYSVIGLLVIALAASITSFIQGRF